MFSHLCSSLLSNQRIPHPTNVLDAKRSRLAFREFPLLMKDFSSLSGHLGKGRTVMGFSQFHFGANRMISFRASIY
jgi:hypothetical protein